MIAIISRYGTQGERERERHHDKLKGSGLIAVLMHAIDYLQQMVDIWSIHGPLLSEIGFKCILECAARKEYPEPYILCQYVPHLFSSKEQYRINISEKRVSPKQASP